MPLTEWKFLNPASDLEIANNGPLAGRGKCESSGRPAPVVRSHFSLLIVRALMLTEHQSDCRKLRVYQLCH
jgi:hypothetical protein